MPKVDSRYAEETPSLARRARVSGVGGVDDAADEPAGEQDLVGFADQHVEVRDAAVLVRVYRRQDGELMVVLVLCA
jgi:hypothetical protein